MKFISCRLRRSLELRDPEDEGHFDLSKMSATAERSTRYNVSEHLNVQNKVVRISTIANSYFPNKAFRILFTILALNDHASTFIPLHTG